MAARRERIVHAPDCVNTATFHPAARDEAWRQARRAQGIADDAVVVVYLGLLADYQGTAQLLEALALLVRRGARVHLLLGGYPNIEHYRQLAHDLGMSDHVTFAGRVPYEQAPAFLALGDIAVAPKLSKTEGAGKILNYMAVGLPTVVYDTAVSREYLGELGVYAALGDVADLAARLGELVDDPPRRAALGATVATTRDHVIRLGAHWRRHSGDLRGATGGEGSAEVAGVSVQGGSAAGVPEKCALARLELALAHHADQRGHRPPGVDGIEQQPLQPRQHRDRFALDGRHHAIARPCPAAIHAHPVAADAAIKPAAAPP